MTTLSASISLDAGVGRVGGQGNRPSATSPGAPDQAFGDILDRTTPRGPKSPPAAKPPSVPQAARAGSPQGDAKASRAPGVDDAASRAPQPGVPDPALPDESAPTTREDEATTRRVASKRRHGNAEEASADVSGIPGIASTTIGKAVAPAQTVGADEVPIDSDGPVSRAGATPRSNGPTFAAGETIPEDLSTDSAQAVASTHADARRTEPEPGIERAQHAVAARADAVASRIEAAAGSNAPPVDASGGAPVTRGDLAVSVVASVPAATAHVADSAAAIPTVEPDLHSPAFAPALGARVALLVRDGIREARVQVNPAGLGPVDVRIEVDRNLAARVDMLAEQATTRAALEQALPALAVALRESGLTLTGGGVFDPARDSGAHDGGERPGADGQPRAKPDTASHDGRLGLDAVHTASGATGARGLVDLYA